jgi:hypothetical protein
MKAPSDTDPVKRLTEDVQLRTALAVLSKGR